MGSNAYQFAILELDPDTLAVVTGVSTFKGQYLTATETCRIPAEDPEAGLRALRQTLTAHLHAVRAKPEIFSDVFERA